MTTVFVFGSNRIGQHGRGAALEAWRKWGAQRGVGEGLVGRSYALPTKETPYITLTLDQIRVHAARFLLIAAKRPDLKFLLTKVGCGLAKFGEADIAPMFADAPDNVVLVDEQLRELCPARDWAQRCHGTGDGR